MSNINLNLQGINRFPIQKKIKSMNVLPAPKLWCSENPLLIPINRFSKKNLSEIFYTRVPKLSYKNLILEEENRKVAYMFDDLTCEQMKRFRNSNIDTIDSQFEKKYLGRISYSLSDKIKNVQEEFPILPDYYYKDNSELKKFTYIYMIESKIKDKRIGTKLICNAIQEGITHGSQGRVLLEAVDMQQGRGSPIKFYKKLGFKFCDETLDKKVEEMIARNENLENLDPDYKTGMYLPKERVSDILKLGRSFEVII